jgi:hypothetical protein
VAFRPMISLNLSNSAPNMRFNYGTG